MTTQEIQTLRKLLGIMWHEVFVPKHRNDFGGGINNRIIVSQDEMTSIKIVYDLIGTLLIDP